MARRYAKRRDPVVPKIQKVELEEGNLALRLLGVGIAIAVAVAAFGYFVSSLLTGDTGWQEISVSRSETGISTQFILSYNVGAGNRAVTAEKKAVSLCYGDTADEAYRVLSNQEFPHYQNLFYLNAHPNEPTAVDPLLYNALRTVQNGGSRYPYFAPLFGMYNSLFASQNDSEAAKFDPELDGDAMAFVQEIRSFAADPEAVRLELLEDTQVVLHVSDAYLQYAQENDVESFYDLGIWQNAFILDAIADALIAQELTNGSISSYDGYSRTLSDASYRQNVYDWVDGKAVQTGTVEYTKKMSLATVRSFPMLAKDSMSYYVYADGTLRAPYVGTDGLLHAGAGSLMLLSGEDSCGVLAMKALDAYTAKDFSSEGVSCSWVMSMAGKLSYGGADITVAK